MNTKIIFSAIVSLLLSANIYASQPIVYKNEIKTEGGKQIEITIFKKNSDVLDKRVLSDYDESGVLIQKTTYRWDGFDGWMPQTKLAYTYTAANELATVEHTRWNDVKNTWDSKSDVSHYDATANKVSDLAESL